MLGTFLYEYSLHPVWQRKGIEYIYYITDIEITCPNYSKNAPKACKICKDWYAGLQLNTSGYHAPFKAYTVMDKLWALLFTQIYMSVCTSEGWLLAPLRFSQSRTNQACSVTKCRKKYTTPTRPEQHGYRLLLVVELGSWVIVAAKEAIDAVTLANVCTCEDVIWMYMLI